MDVLESLKQALSGHDWYYDRSDDHSVWSRGAKSWQNICDLWRAARAQGLSEEADKIYNEACSKIRGVL